MHATDKASGEKKSLFVVNTQGSKCSSNNKGYAFIKKHLNKSVKKNQNWRDKRILYI
jgi:hypothetical protein